MGNYYALKLKAFLLILELRKCQLVPYYRGEFGTQMEPKMAKRVPPLTAKQVENFRPTDRAELTDGLVPGLRLRATASGVRSWSLNIRGYDGRRRFEVGVGLGLAEARRAAEVIRARVRLGEDPSAARKEARMRAKDAREGVGTLSGLIDAYGRARGEQLRSWSAARALMRAVFVQLLDKPVLQLTAAEFHLAGDICNSAYSAGTAVRYVRPILRWGAQRGAAPDGIATALRPRRGAVTRRDRVIEPGGASRCSGVLRVRRTRSCRAIFAAHCGAARGSVRLAVVRDGS